MELSTRNVNKAVVSVQDSEHLETFPDVVNISPVIQVSTVLLVPVLVADPGNVKGSTTYVDAALRRSFLHRYSLLV